MSTLLKMQKFHPLCSRCIGMYPLQNRWTVLRYLQCYENFSECCTHLILPETALFSPTPTFAKEPKILVVEDEVQLADTLVEILKRNKYNVDTVFDGDDGLEYARTGIYDCILLDIMLPVRSGTEIVQILRREKNATPIMLLTAKSEVEDKIHGLDCGADDYLTKPFSTGELLARIRALTRRKGEVEVDCLHFAELQLNRQTYDLIQGENRMKLSLKEYQIMEMLLSNPEQIIPKERFIEKIWGYESDVEYNNIEVYISFLRKKLTAIHSTVQIRTARGIGYFLEKKA